MSCNLVIEDAAKEEIAVAHTTYTYELFESCFNTTAMPDASNLVNCATINQCTKV